MFAFLRKTLAAARTHRRRTFVFLLGLVVIPVGTWLIVKQRREDALLGEAEQAIAAYDLVAARTKLEEFLTNHPDEAKAHFLLGQTARRAEAYELAVKHFQQARKLGWPEVEIDMEMLMLRGQQGDRTVAAALRKLANEKDSPQAPLAAEVLTLQYLQAGDLTAATPLVGAALKRNPNDVPALLSRGILHEKQGDLPAAIADYRKAAELRPDSLGAHLRLADALLASGSPEEAVRAYQAGVRIARTAAVLLGMAKAERKLAHYKLAREALDELLQQSPRNVPAMLERAGVALDAGETDKAEADFRLALQVVPQDPELNRKLADCLKKLGPSRQKEAEKYAADADRYEANRKKVAALTEQLSKRPRDARLRCDIADIFFGEGRDDDGELWLKQAIAADSSYVPAHEALIRYYDRRGATALVDQHRRILAALTKKGD